MLLPIIGFSQPAETSNLTTYDSTYTDGGGTWIMRITRPVNLFTPGNPDTASRPLILMMPGQGQMGSTNTANLTAYGPHAAMLAGWNSAITCGNGIHYPIYITVSYVNNVYPNPSQFYSLFVYILTHYHIKSKAVYLTGFSQGAFTTGGLIEYEGTLGDHAGMKLVTALAELEGTPTTPANEFPVRAQNCNWSECDTNYYKTWAKEYGGKYFYLEGSGSDNFRNGYIYSAAMNDTVPGSAYFSYENADGGAHGGWDLLYSPSVTNFTCVGILGTYNSPSQAGTNTMGTYKNGENIYTWMFKQGDTSMVLAGPAPLPPVAIISNAIDSVTIPSDTITLIGGTSYDNGGTISSYTWTQTSGPIQAAIVPNGSNCSIGHLALGAYTFELTVKDNNGNSSSTTATVVER